MKECKTCEHNGNQMIFKSKCTGCGDGEYLHWEPTAAEYLKCCGNCKYYDVVDNIGSVCLFDKLSYQDGFPVEHTAICDDWQYDIAIYDNHNK